MHVDVKLVRRTDVSLHMSKEEWHKIREMLRRSCTAVVPGSLDETDLKVFINEMVRKVDDTIQFEEND